MPLAALLSDGEKIVSSPNPHSKLFRPLIVQPKPIEAVHPVLKAPRRGAPGAWSGLCGWLREVISDGSAVFVRSLTLNPKHQTPQIPKA